MKFSIIIPNLNSPTIDRTLAGVTQMDGFGDQVEVLIVGLDAPQLIHESAQVRFILGFQEQGARLRLTVVSPEGKKREAEGTSTLVIEETCPVVGEWRYTVTALAVPFPDFPFTLTVGESR